MAWEYLTVELPGADMASEWTTALNTYAADGWELQHLALVEVITEPLGAGTHTWNTFHAVFRRAKA
jgi:hypothetical protein